MGVLGKLGSGQLKDEGFLVFLETLLIRPFEAELLYIFRAWQVRASSTGYIM